MDSRSNLRVDPRRRMACSIVSVEPETLTRPPSASLEASPSRAGASRALSLWERAREAPAREGEASREAEGGRVRVSGSTDTIEQAILRRGSTRKFERESITLDQLLTILTTSTQPIW